MTTTDTVTETPTETATQPQTETQAALKDLALAAVRLMALQTGEAPPPGASLTVVGTGIRAITQLSVEVLATLASAEVLLHVVGEPTQEAALKAINPAAETLTHYYVDGLDRSATYEAMVQHILGAVAEGKRTVAAFYGHPGVFTYPSHESVRRARAAGFPARMLPAISAADCLWADLGVDPGLGSQEYEATDFPFLDRHVDPRAHLLVWQVGAIEHSTYESTACDLRLFPSLVPKLLRTYPPGHVVTLYEGPFTAGAPARAQPLPLGQLAAWQVTGATTLHVGPLFPAY